MSITQSQMQHLAYVRYLHLLAIDQAKLPEPMCSTSILLLHDAAESFLMLAAGHFNLPDSGEFLGYWKVLKPHLSGQTLPMEPRMKIMNTVRKELKHRGVQPSRRSIEDALADTATLLASGVQMVFDIDYSSISMVSLISQDLPRQLAGEAEAAAVGGDIVAGMKRLREAFDQLFAVHLPVSVGLRRSDFSFGPMLRDIGHFSRTGTDLDEAVKRLVEAVRPIQEGMRLVSLGLDRSEFLRFDRLTPQYSSNYQGGIQWTAPRGYAPDQEAFDFCMQFVVMAALRLAAAEARAADPAWMERDYSGRFETQDLGEEPAVENRYAAPTDEISF
ncbi:hypothetical protein [Glycomyces tritici]|uniref:VWA domain-containing protein n=1 Tax=Glycomyces tritici TaxID=2665176 RepID=A0ABT7YLA0_9ACTN|nr:hypothetical protein [Glycomyces tritici]MDN3239224.1 hypothetical protein [Glycomyces tritici]